MIAIVDYGMGNLGSIRNMLKKIGAESKITSDKDEISKSDKLILPGVGAFDTAVQKIIALGWKEILDRKVLIEKTPALGICLGMQLLTAKSEEGKLPGLGWIAAETVRFSPINSDLKVPHMGWNMVHIANRCYINENLPFEPRFYFVHSYYVKVKNEENSMLKTNYGVEFDSGIFKDNIFGVQFHPEKSHFFGMALLKNFATI